MTLVQSLYLVCRIFNFDSYSFVIKITIDVNEAVILVSTIPLLGLVNSIVGVVKADLDPIKISVLINDTFLLLNFLFFFL